MLVVRWVDRLGRNYEDVCDTIREFMRMSLISVFDGLACALFDGSIGADRLPDATERAAVLAAVKDASRR